jgi:hypothetical protein
MFPSPRRLPSPRRTAAAAILGLTLSAAAIQPTYAAPGDPVEIATGLNNPRQLSVGPGQRLYVAEAGTSEDCNPGPDGGGMAVCGLTGSVTEVKGKNQKRVVEDVPAMLFNGEVLGASDVDVRSNNISLLIGGMAGATAIRDTLDPKYAALGTLRTGRVTDAAVSAADLDLAADLNAYEIANDPDGQDHPDSNPVGFVATNSKNWVIADAGGNDLVAVGRNGERTIAVFPPVSGAPQTVPTDVAKGPDGALYMSQLTGFPFPKGGSTIWRVTLDGQVTEYATGLTNVTSLAWKGNQLYAVQLADEGLLSGPVGSLRKVVKGSDTHPVVADGLTAPYGLAIRGNSAYVTVNSIAQTAQAGDGAVLEIQLR